MHEPPETADSAPGRKLVKILGRTILSTATIGIVAIGIFAVFHGYYRPALIKIIIYQNLPLLSGVCTGLFAWNCWLTFRGKAG